MAVINGPARLMTEGTVTTLMYLHRPNGGGVAEQGAEPAEGLPYKRPLLS